MTFELFLPCHESTVLRKYDTKYPIRHKRINQVMCQTLFVYPHGISLTKGHEETPTKEDLSKSEFVKYEYHDPRKI